MTHRTANVTTAAHYQGEDGHAVVLEALHVMVEQDGAMWFAQGIEVDYAAAGYSLDDVRERFERGLRRTIQENLRHHSGIERLLRFAPPDVVEAFKLCPRRYEVDHVSEFDLSDLLPTFPFRKLAYDVRALA